MTRTTIETGPKLPICPNAHNAPEFALPDRLEDASFFADTPFPIFEIENFLPWDFYADLVADVQDRVKFDRVFSKKGNKKKLSLRGKNFERFPSSPFKSLVARAMSQSFFDWFMKTHLPYYETAAQPVLVQDKSSVDLEAMRRADAAAGIERAYYDVEAHYSSIEQGGFIPPHTDSPKKRLSFVLYLPSEPLPEDMQRNCGTIFYAPKRQDVRWDRFESGLLNEKQTGKFLDEHKPVHVSLFQPNKCVGFIKSGISWHAVAPIEAKYDRRAIVMNIHEL
jgi:hypothetical protein